MTFLSVFLFCIVCRCFYGVEVFRPLTNPNSTSKSKSKSKSKSQSTSKCKSKSNCCFQARPQILFFKLFYEITVARPLNRAPTMPIATGASSSAADVLVGVGVCCSIVWQKASSGRAARRFDQETESRCAGLVACVCKLSEKRASKSLPSVRCEGAARRHSI